LKPKDLIGIPWRVAFALQEDGWVLRSDTIWAKPNPMPESVTDRPTKSHEYVFLLAKQPRYFYDAEAIAEPAQPFRAGGANNALDNPKTPKTNKKQDELGKNTYTGFNDRWAESGGVANRNARSVWNIATQPYSGAHFATMPPELARRCILAGTSARGQCPKCGAPWARVVETERKNAISRQDRQTATGGAITGGVGKNFPETTSVTTGWEPTCQCQAGDPIPQIVIDPFMGSGTTAMVALQNGRQAIGTELNPAYLRLQDDRTQVTMGLGL
jgi:DNA modification methylase